ncbi:MAG: XRE family transcriptional regulator [Flavobacterium sp.]|nr:MAG: XRE family transcriptional regulator [Flavobacterium sp.]
MLKNQKFKQARKAAGFTQKEFAKKLGTNQAYEEEMVNNVLAFLKKKGKPVTELINDMGISRTAFYYQIKSDNMKQSFKDSFQKATGFNIIDIVNEKAF